MRHLQRATTAISAFLQASTCQDCSKYGHRRPNPYEELLRFSRMQG